MTTDETNDNTPLEENSPQENQDQGKPDLSQEVSFDPAQEDVSREKESQEPTTKPVKYRGRKAVKYRASKCLNCGHPMELTDVYCSYCAQMNSTKKLSLGDFFEELFSSIINYDSRFRTSIKTLLFKPGVMSREFINGKRMKYVNPFRFYLSISILFFVMLGLIANFEDININNSDDLQDQLENGVANIVVDGVKVGNLAELDSIIKANNGPEMTLDSLISQRKAKRDSAAAKKSYRERYLPEKANDTMPFFTALYERGKLYAEFNQETGIKSSRRGLDSLKHTDNAYHRWLYRKAIDAETLSAEGPGEILGYFLNQLPFVIFFFIPIFALFVWLVYIRRKQYSYTDHMVFLFHTQTMFFVLFGIALIIDTLIEGFTDNYESGIASGVATLVLLFYLYKAMRNFYQQGRIKTIVKFLILNSVFFILAVFGAAVAFIISFATY